MTFTHLLFKDADQCFIRK